MSVTDHRAVPLPYVQRELWFRDRFEPISRDRGAHNTAVALELTGALDRAALESALRRVVERHESLRTVYPDVAGEPVAVTRPMTEIADAGALMTVETASVRSVRLTMRTYATRPFDLTTDLPVRATLLRLGPTSSILLLVVHTIAMDDASVAPLLHDLAAAYGAGEQPDRASPLPARAAGAAPGSTAFWTRTLAGAPEELTLPVDRPRSASAPTAGATVRAAVDPATHTGLVGLARRSGSDVFTVVHAAAAMLLHQLGAGTDIVIGTTASGRTEQTAAAVGVFANPVALRTDLRGALTFARLLTRVRVADQAAFGHSGVPFGQVVEAVNPLCDATRNPVFQVGLAVRSERAGQCRLAGLDVVVRPIPTAVTRLDLAFDVTGRTDGSGAPAELAIALGYRTDLFDEETATAIVGRFVRLLRAVVAVPEMPIAGPEAHATDRPPLTTRTERQQPITACPDRSCPDRSCPELPGTAASRTDWVAQALAPTGARTAATPPPIDLVLAMFGDIAANPPARPAVH